MNPMPIAGPAVLTLVGVSKTFKLGEVSVNVLQEVSFSVRPGESVAVTGPSGSGKTTLLHVAAGLECPDTGSVRVAQSDPYTMTEAGRAAFRRRTIGLVFQQHHLLPQLTALENVLLPTLAESRRATREDVARAEALLETVGLARRANHRPAQLSGGERQRVAVARALINRPSLVLADEPTAALDRNTARDVAQLLARLVRGTQTALLVATHDPELARLLDRTLELRDGVADAPSATPPDPGSAACG